MTQHHLKACPRLATGVPTDCSCDKEVRHYLNLAKPVVIASVLMLIGGLLTNSKSLISEGLHQLADSAESVTNAFVSYFARRGDEDKVRTYGVRVGAMLLLVAGAYIAVEGVERILHPALVHPIMIAFALFGLIFTLWLRKKHHGASKEHCNENHRMQDWHLLTDLAVNGSVLVGGTIMWMKGGWYFIDGYLALFIGVFVSVLAVARLFGIKMFTHHH